MASRTGWLLGLDRVSMTTMSPGASAGTRTCLTYSRKLLQEALAIDGAVEELGGGHAAQPQPGNERGLLAVPVRDRCAQAHSSRRAAVQASHGGGGKALVDEHELRRIEIELGFEPVLTSLHHIGAGLLGGVQGLLFEGQAAAIEEGPDRAGAGTHAFLRDEPALQFFDGGVRCGLDHRQQDVAMGGRAWSRAGVLAGVPNARRCRAYARPT